MLSEELTGGEIPIPMTAAERAGLEAMKRLRGRAIASRSDSNAETGTDEAALGNTDAVTDESGNRDGDSHPSGNQRHSRPSSAATRSAAESSGAEVGGAETSTPAQDTK